MRWRAGIVLSAVAATVLVTVPAALSGATDDGRGSSRQVAFGFVGRYATGLAGTSAETTALSGDRMYVTNATENALDIVDIANPADPTLLTRLDLDAYGASATSVATSDGLVAVAVAASPKTSPGKVVLMDRRGRVVGTAQVGANPDALTFTPDGRRIVVANEGEPESYEIGPSGDPEGSVSIVHLPARRALDRAPAPFTLPVRHARFDEFNVGARRNRELPAGIRIFGPNASVAQDVEPEYVTVDERGRTAYVTLQENNAMAIVDIDSARVKRIVALGVKDHGKSPIDASDRDSGQGNTGAINIKTWAKVYGMYQPDQVAAFTVRGRTYLLTANEGDSRTDWDGLDEEARARDVADTAEIPAAASNAQLGRLTVTNQVPATPTGQKALYAFGSRSFSVWDEDVRQVWDSDDLLEQLTARVFPADFNSNNDANGTFDTRSDNKGPEPEGVTVGEIDGRTYGFVGLERQGGVVVTDLSDPRSPVFQQYLVTRQFAGSTLGPDSGPEGLAFASKGPNRRPLLAVANEVTGTVALFTTIEPDGPTGLTVLHNNDGESSLLSSTVTSGGATTTFGSVAGFKSVTDREIRGARDAARSVVNVYAGDAFLAGATLACSNPDQPTGPVYDAIAQRRIAYDAHIFGNHEFDYTPTFLERFVRQFADPQGRLTQPFLSANLRFTGEPTWADLLDADGLIVGQASNGRVVARSAVVVDPTTTARVGIVAATTPDLVTISSPRNVAVTSTDIATTAPIVQAEIDRLTRMGVRKIVLVSHLQSIANDVQLVGLLRNVDAAVAGGGDELLANASDLLVPGDGTGANPVVGPYPRIVTDAAGTNVPLVTTNGNYKYVGRLDIAFDAAGAATVQGGGPKRVVLGSTAGALPDQVAPDAALVTEVQQPVTSCLSALAATAVASTEVVFDRGRPGVRGRQSNAGNLVADAWLDTYDRNRANVGLPARTPRTIAVQNGGGIRDNGGNFLPSTNAPGVISRLDILNMLPFDNTMVVVSNVTPADLKEILERSAASLPGQGGQFLQLAGLKVTYEVSRQAQVITSAGVVTTPGQRVREVALANGTPIVTAGAVVAGAPSVDVVTNNFTAGGGDNYPWLRDTPSKTVLRTAAGLAIPYELPVREYLASFPVGAGGQPTVPASDTRYAPYPTGDVSPAGARITILP